LIDDEAKSCETLRAALEDSGPGAERIDDHERPRDRLIPDELKHRRQAGPDLLPPASLTLICRAGDRGDPGDRVVEHREETVFAVGEGEAWIQLRQVAWRRPARPSLAGDRARRPGEI